MKRFIVSLAAAVSLGVASFSSHALTIDAVLESFESNSATISGVGSGGGFGTFSLLTDVTGTEIDFLGQEFLAMCLEPDEFITTGTTYTFDVVALADAPSATGGMGTEGQSRMEQVLGYYGTPTIEAVQALSNPARNAIQMAAYEVGYENNAVNGFDFTSGAAIVTGVGASENQDLIDTINEGDFADLVQAFGLVNIGTVPADRTRTVYVAQDFMIATEQEGEDEPVPAPAPLALLGLGLVGMIGARRFMA